MVPVRRNQNWMSNIFNDIFDDNFMVRTSTTAPAMIAILTAKKGMNLIPFFVSRSR